MATLRLFIACELPPDLRQELVRTQSTLQKRLTGRAFRWSSPETIHLTLKFLGDTPASKVEAIRAALDALVANHQPLSLRVEGLGCFPNARRPRVLWAGVEGDAARLGSLQAAVERAMEDQGFPPEGRGFSPHLTLCRVKGEVPAAQLEAVGTVMASVRTAPLPWPVSAISLMQSDLHPEGAVYTRLHEAAL